MKEKMVLEIANQATKMKKGYEEQISKELQIVIEKEKKTKDNELQEMRQQHKIEKQKLIEEL